MGVDGKHISIKINHSRSYIQRIVIYIKFRLKINYGFNSIQHVFNYYFFDFFDNDQNCITVYMHCHIPPPVERKKDNTNIYTLWNPNHYTYKVI